MLQVVAGELTLSIFEGIEQTRSVIQIIIHEDYNPSYSLNDIALLKLEQTLEFSSFVGPIPLPVQGESTNGNCIVSDILQKVTVPVVSDEECRRNYAGLEVADSMICAGYPEGGKDSCQGDSGGPMECGGYLAGIVSWGRGCALAGYPGVYTETAYYVNWIKENAL
ncbi:UNVERIFIED_CONTAM: hypothetical protein GTU68_048044 [Idotea baltica]|nr:hypothetical protein [Idotea baltica]